MYIEKVLPQITGAITEVESMLEETMTDALRVGLEGEHRRLVAAQEALTGEGKSHLHALRARLRWTRIRATDEKDAAKRKPLEREIKNLENQIHREAALRGKA
jgi:hypothetical protein